MSELRLSEQQRIALEHPCLLPDQSTRGSSESTWNSAGPCGTRADEGRTC
jgi:hypothetical protein